MEFEEGIEGDTAFGFELATHPFVLAEVAVGEEEVEAFGEEGDGFGDVV